MEKTTNLFKKTGNIKGTFHARMGMIKDRNGKDLRKADTRTKLAFDSDTDLDV